MAKHYKIKLSALFLFTVNATEWNQAVARGWIVPRNERVAVLASGVQASLSKRSLTLKDENWNDLFVLTSWLKINRQAPVTEA
jgi:hypothetical protein